MMYNWSGAGTFLPLSDISASFPDRKCGKFDII
jgi:hypothetical protein